MSKPGLGTGYDPLEGILTPPSSPTPVKSDRPVKVVDRTPDAPGPTAVTAGRRQPAITPPPQVRQGRHKLTTYLPVGLYEWVAAEVDSATGEGYAASIADVVRMALEQLRSGDVEVVRKRLRGQ